MSKEIEKFFPKDVPKGWVTLPQGEKDHILEETSLILTDFAESGARSIKAIIRTSRLREYLRGKATGYYEWAKAAFGSISAVRTLDRQIERFEEMRQGAPEDAIVYLAEQGIAGLPGDLVNAIKQLPAPKDKKSYPTWAAKVGEILREDRRRRTKGGSRKISEDEAVLTIVLSSTKALKEAKLETTAKEAAVLRRAIGYTMERRAMRGTVSAERTPIPEGFIPKVGRPRKQRGRPKKAA